MTSLSKLRLAAVLALSGSTVLHVAAMAIAPSNRADVQIEGGQATEMAGLGNSFADLVRASDNFEPVTAEDEVRPVEAKSMPVRTATEFMQPVEPEMNVAASVPMTALEPLPNSPAIASPVPVTNDPDSPQPALSQPVEPESVAPVSTPANPQQIKEKATKVSPVKPTETIGPVEEPKPEPVLERKSRPKPKPEPGQNPAKKKPVSGHKAGNSTADSKAGSQKGKASAKAVPRGNNASKSKSRNTGSAAASNYPGKVYSKIARTRQKNAGGRGVAHVSFQVTSNGKATGIALSRSSGNARVDRAAVAHVRRASPFPKPPPGAKSRFVIPIEFRR